MRQIFWKFYDAAATAGGGGETLTILKGVSEKQEQITKELKETREAREANEKVMKEWKESLEKLQKEVTEKGGTIADIQKGWAELNAKFGTAPFANNGQPVRKSYNQLISKAIRDNAALIKEEKKGHYFKVDPVEAGMVIEKAVGTLSLSNVTAGSITGMPSVGPDPIANRGFFTTHFRDIARIVDSATGQVLIWRQKIPAGEGSFGDTAAGTTKNQVDYDYDLIVTSAAYKNGYANVHKGMLNDIPYLESSLTEELVNDYLDRETFDFFEQLQANATGVSTSSGANAAEKIIDYIANLMQRKYSPTAIVGRPALWASILKTKPADYSIPGGFVITPNGDVYIGGIKLSIVATNSLSDSKIIVGDFRKAEVVQVLGEGLKVQMFDQHDRAVYFNEVTFRAEARVAMQMKRLDAFVVGS